MQLSQNYFKMLVHQRIIVGVRYTFKDKMTLVRFINVLATHVSLTSYIIKKTLPFSELHI